MTHVHAAGRIQSAGKISAAHQPGEPGAEAGLIQPPVPAVFVPPVFAIDPRGVARGGDDSPHTPSGHREAPVGGGDVAGGTARAALSLATPLAQPATQGTTATPTIEAYTGGEQVFTVQTTGEYLIEAFGAAGYNGDYSGGAGAEAEGTYFLTSGETIDVYVGGTATGIAGLEGGGGGGGSFVEVSGGALLLAGGGGGGSGEGSAGGSGQTGTSGQAGVAGGSGGMDGSGGSSYEAEGAASAGGAGVFSNGASSGAIQGGQDLANGFSGGMGLEVKHGKSYDETSGGYGGGGGGSVFGGGGGGYSGGGGGGVISDEDHDLGGGGGGGSYVDTTAADGYEAGADTLVPAAPATTDGNGEIVFQLTLAVPSLAINYAAPGETLVAPGDSLTLIPAGAPFSFFDPNGASVTDTFIISLSGGGTLSDGTGFNGLTYTGNQSWDIVGTAAQITSEVNALVFTGPSLQSGSTSATTTANFFDVSSANPGQVVDDLNAITLLTKPPLDYTAPNEILVSTGGSVSLIPSGAPFSFFDPYGASVTDTFIISLGGGGTLSDGAGFDGLTSTGTQSWDIAGTAAQISSEVNALIFTAPTLQPGSQSTTTVDFLDISSDTPGQFVSDLDAITIQTSAPSVAPTITGTAGGQTASGSGPVQIFEATKITDATNGGSNTDTLSITFGGGGTLSGAGLSGSSGNYTLTGTALQITTALDALEYAAPALIDPANATTTFTLTVTDPVAGTSATDTTTTLEAPINTIDSAVSSAVTLGNGTYADAVTITGAGNVNLSFTGNNAATAVTIGQNDASLLNEGIIAGSIGGGEDGPAVSLSSGTLTNASAGTISGGETGNGGVAVSQSGGTLLNTGTIAGGMVALSGGIAVSLSGGTLTNESGGLIVGAAGRDGAAGDSAVSLSNGSVTNDGSIQGGNGAYGGAVNGGVAVLQIGGTFFNDGTLTGGNGSGPEHGNGGAGAYLDGGTLTNAGTLSGGSGFFDPGLPPADDGSSGVAVLFGAQAATLVVDPTAVFNGNVVANSSVNDVLVLGGGAAATLGGLGGQFTGFSTLDFSGGASWTVDSTLAALDGGQAIEGFSTTDTIVLTNFAAASESFGSNLLTLASGNSTATLDIALPAGDFLAVTASSTATTITAVAAPVITGTVAGQQTNGAAQVAVFAGAGITDANSGGSLIDTLTITYGGTGTLSGAGLSGSSDNYTLTGTALQITNALDALEYAAPALIDPANATTTFTLTVTDPVAGTNATDTTTTLTAPINTIDSSVSTGVALGSGTYADTVTITAAGAVSPGLGVATAVTLSAGDSLINQGRVTGSQAYAGNDNYGPGGTGGTGGTGLSLGAGSATNEATIMGGAGGNGGAGFGNGGNGGGGGTGVSLSGGSATNEATITGGAGGNGGPSENYGTGGTGGTGGAGASLTSGTLTNLGTITGGSGGGGGYGSGGGGKGSGGSGVTISGGTLINAGTITGVGGAYAVQFGSAAGTLVVDPTAVFNGNVVANGNVNDVLVLGGNSTASGVLTGLGAQFRYFSTLDFSAGPGWTVDSSIGALDGGQAIDGFSTTDTIVLTDFAAASESFGSNGLTLTSNNTTDTLDIAPPAGDFLAVTASSTATTITADAAVAPVITGTAANQQTNGAAQFAVFASAGITDANSGGSLTDTLTITYGGDGTLSGVGLSVSSGTYTLTGTALQITTALDALEYAPPAQIDPADATTTLTLTVTDPVAGTSATDTTTTLTAPINTIDSAVRTAVTLGNGTYSNTVTITGTGSVNEAASDQTAIFLTAGTENLVNQGQVVGGGGGGGSDGENGGNGGQGGNGASLILGSIINEGVISGGQGGVGGESSDDSDTNGGNGGNGGAGMVLFSGASSNEGTVFGGQGGAGGHTGDAGGDIGGYGGSGGSGLLLSGGVFTNEGTVVGGDGGNGGFSVSGSDGANGSGGSGVSINGGTLVNAGTITGAGGADAVQFGSAAGTLVVDPTAVFNGNVAANGVNDVLVLGTSTTSGVLSGLGGQFTGFSTLDFSANATWTVDSTLLALDAGQAIEGFSTTDTIVLASFAATSETYIAGTGLELGSGGTAATLDIAPPAGDFLAVTAGSSATTITAVAAVAPVITGTAAGQQTNGAAQVAVFAGVGIIDANSFGSLTDTLTITYGGDGTLIGAGLSGSVGSYTLTGTALQITTALDALEYAPPALTDPANATTTFTLTVADPVAGTSATDTTTTLTAPINTIDSAVSNAVTLGNGTYADSVTITAAGTANPTANGVTAVTLNAFGETLLNQGRIIGGRSFQSYGVGVSISGGTLVNAGTISGALGADAVQFGSAAGTLVVDPTAVFNGNVVANGVNDVLVLGGTAAATLVGLGGQFLRFSTLDFSANATWTVDSSFLALDQGQAVEGFSTTDTIVLQNFAATSETYIAGTGLELGSGGTTATLDIAPPASDFLAVTSSSTATTITADTGLAPSIGVTGRTSFATISEATLNPFAGTTVTDPNLAQSVTDTLTIALAGNGGTLMGTGLTGSGALYTLTGSAATIDSELAALVFKPTAGQPNTSNTTTFALSDRSSATAPAVSNSQITVTDTDPAQASTFAGVPATVTTNDETPIDPFAGVTVTDPNAGTQLDAVIISLIGGDADGTLSLAGGGLVKNQPGLYTLSATSPATLNQELKNLVFTPTPHQVAPGSTVFTGFSLVLENEAGFDTYATGTLTATAVGVASTLSNTVPGQTTTNETPAQVFKTVQVADSNGGSPTETLTITYAGGGTLSGSSLLTGSAGSYKLTGTAASVTKALEALLFTPAIGQPNSSSTTTFTLSDLSSVYATATANSLTTLTDTYSAQASTLAGVPATIGTTDETAFDPFAGVTVIDPNAVIEADAVIISLAGGDADGTLSLSGGSLVKNSAGLYTLSATTPATLNQELKNLVFTPMAHQAAPGSTVSTGFTLVLENEAGFDTYATGTLTAKAVNDAPAITGALPGQTTLDNAPIKPFATASITDPDISVTDSLTITLKNTSGVATDADGTLSGSGLTKTGTGTYSLAATSPATLTAELEALVFTPTARQVGGGATVTTSFTVAASQTAGGSTVTTTNSATSVSVTAVTYINGPAYGYGTIEGTAGVDYITAYGYYNTIYDNGGNDVVYAGSGDATVYTNTGNVTVYLGGYFNTVSGGNGNTSVSGALGNTSVSLGNGSDNVVVGGYFDTVALGNGNDMITGPAGNATVSIGTGSDSVTLGGYSNNVTAGSTVGSDIINAGLGLATVVGGNGNFSITAGGTGDVITLGNGTDVVTGMQGLAKITTGSGNDTVVLGGYGSTVNAGSGTNSITGGLGNDTFFLPVAGTGTDTISHFTLSDGDTLNLASALAATTWNFQSSTLGNYLKVSESGGNALIGIAPAGSGAVTTIADLVGVSNLTLATLLPHTVL